MNGVAAALDRDGSGAAWKVSAPGGCQAFVSPEGWLLVRRILQQLAAQIPLGHNVRLLDMGRSVNPLWGEHLFLALKC
jgi:hypothetical protein